jgi:uncharacterized membrane protein YqgA involved in biofilm formation
MLGVLVNFATVLAGSFIGMLLKNNISEKVTKAIMSAIGVCTICIGIKGLFNGSNTLALILSMAIGTGLGTVIDIDGWISKLGQFAEKKVVKKGDGNVAEGFVTACLLFCVGSMTVVGCLQAGLSGNMEMLYTKSVLDLISSMVLASSLGIGVMISSAFVLVFQGALVLLSGLLQPVLTTELIGEMTCAGSAIIIALGLNLLNITKLKVANFLPAIILAPVISWLLSLAGIG